MLGAFSLYLRPALQGPTLIRRQSILSRLQISPTGCVFAFPMPPMAKLLEVILIFEPVPSVTPMLFASPEPASRRHDRSGAKTNIWANTHAEFKTGQAPSPPPTRRAVARTLSGSRRVLHGETLVLEQALQL